METQIEHFENTTITLEHVTENYLEGEQRTCDVWAHYINNEHLTMEDAISFIRISHVLQSASAHIVYSDTLSGLSTRAKHGNPDDYAVSYARTELLSDVTWIHDLGEAPCSLPPVRAPTGLWQRQGWGEGGGGLWPGILQPAGSAEEARAEPRLTPLQRAGQALRQEKGLFW